MFEPVVIIPTPVSKFGSVGSVAADKSKPWKEDGKTWHLEKRCNPDSRTILKELLSALGQIPVLDGPHWGQQIYISYKIKGRNFLIINTLSTQIELTVPVSSEIFNIEETAIKLGLKLFQTEVSPSEKKALSSSIALYGESVKIRCKQGIVFTDEFAKFIQGCVDAMA